METDIRLAVACHTRGKFWALIRSAAYRADPEICESDILPLSMATPGQVARSEPCVHGHHWGTRAVALVMVMCGYP